VASLYALHFTRSAMHVREFDILQRYHAAFRPSNVNAIFIKTILHLFHVSARENSQRNPLCQTMRSLVSAQGQTNTVSFAGGSTKTSLSGHFWRPS
jgi:hypothetical protein